MIAGKNLKVLKTLFFFIAGMVSIGILNTIWVALPSEYSSNTRFRRFAEADNEGSKGFMTRAAVDTINVHKAMDDGFRDGEEQPSRCIKRVHIFGSMERLKWIPELNHFRSLLETSKLNGFESDLNCSSPLVSSRGHQCDIKLTLGTEREHLAGKDAVIFGMIATTWITRNLLRNVLKIKPEPGQTWIFYSTETPYRVLKWAGGKDLGKLKYHVLMTYHRKSDIHVPFGYYRPFTGPNDGPTDTRFLRDEFYTNRTGLLSWVATNCNDVFWPRMPFIEALRKEIPLDDYGVCGHKECLPRRSPRCNELFASYKFYLSIPNAECRDYITEKFWMISLKYGAVPLVLGTVKEDYEQLAPPNSFVHFNHFKSIKDAADHLKRVDQNETLYRQYHEWRRHGEVITSFPYRPETICATIPYIYPRPENEVKVIGDSPWFNECRATPNEMDVDPHFEELGDWHPW